MLKVNKLIASVILEKTNVLKDARQKGLQVLLSRNPSISCWDATEKPYAHDGIIQGMGWQVMRGSEVVREGYITDQSVRELQPRAVEVIASKKSVGLKIVEQIPLPFYGSWAQEAASMLELNGAY